MTDLTGSVGEAIGVVGTCGGGANLLVDGGNVTH
jgi:hypothetical protein